MKITLSKQEKKEALKLLGFVANKGGEYDHYVSNDDAASTIIAKLNSYNRVSICSTDEGPMNIDIDDDAVIAVLRYLYFVSVVTGTDCITAAKALENIADAIPSISNFFENCTLPHLK